MRMQDAVPDELEIIPDGEGSKHTSGTASQNSSQGGAFIPIPKTVVQKVDPISPGHGEAPGKSVRSTHRSDAVPDVIVQVNDPDTTSASELRSQNISPSIPVLETGTARSAPVSSEKKGIGEGAGSNSSGVNGDLDSEKSEAQSKSRFC